MKTLKRIKLVNWHLFQNTTLEWNGSLLISGDNGSGKSTLVDAIHFVLSGSLAKGKFNLASHNAVKGTKRTIETYMRARIGAVGQEFLRPEPDIVSHIALEFDDKEEGPLTVGVVLQISSGLLLTPFRFYSLRDSFSDDLFFEISENGAKTVRNFDNLLNKAKELGVEITAFETQTASGTYAAVRRVLNLPEEYESLLSNAICFDPNADLLQFTNDFLLEKKDVSLDDVKEAARAYQDIALMLGREEEKAASLKPLTVLEKELRDVMRLLDKNRPWRLLASEKEAQERLIDANRRLKDTEEALSSIDKGLKEKKETLDTLVIERKNLGSDSHSTINELEERLNRLDKKKKSLSEEKSYLLALVSSLEWGASDMGFESTLQEAIEKGESSYLRNSITAYQLALSAKRDALRLEKEKASSEKESLILELADVSSKAQMAEFHEKPFPKDVKDFYAYLSKRFDGERGFALNPLCNCLEVVDDKCQSLIESLLLNRRFDVFVPLEHFKECVLALEAYKKQHPHTPVGIIDSAALDEEFPPVFGSIAHMVRSKIEGSDEELPLVRNYVDRLLGEIMYVKDGEKEPDTPYVTERGLYYDGTSIRALETPKSLFIGSKAMALDAEALVESEKRIQALLAEKEETIARANGLLEKGGRLDPTPLRGLSSIWIDERDLGLKEKEIAESLENVRNSMSSESLTSYGEAVQSNEKRQKALEKEIEVLERERESLIGKKAQQSLRVEESSRSLESVLTELRGEERRLGPVLFEEAKKEFATLDLREIDSRFQEGEKKRQKLEREIVKAMTSYNERFEFRDLEPAVFSLDGYLARYRKIVDSSLLEIRSKAEKASKRAIESFKTSFLINLRSNIAQAESLIAKLNRSLKSHPFGALKSVYRFLVKPSDDLELRKIYDIAVKTSEDYFASDLLSQELSRENRETLDRLFRLLSGEDASSYQGALEKFCDYRNYLSYDIVETTEDGEEKRYSDNIRSRSGGETQTPFYVLIAASFDSAFNAKKRSGASPSEIVMLDEAFNNMDSDRIEDMMDFYRSLDIQLLVSVPTSRFAYLAEHVDSTLLLVNKKNRLSYYQGGRLKK